MAKESNPKRSARHGPGADALATEPTEADCSVQTNSCLINTQPHVNSVQRRSETHCKHYLHVHLAARCGACDGFQQSIMCSSRVTWRRSPVSTDLHTNISSECGTSQRQQLVLSSNLCECSTPLYPSFTAVANHGIFEMRDFTNAKRFACSRDVKTPKQSSLLACQSYCTNTFESKCAFCVI